ncbi:hypothetical protein BH10ACI1_BH10ACI1_30610 [soil metagenome]
MKECPQCGRTFTDDNQYCTEDGTTLLSAAVMPTQSYSGDIPTIIVPKFEPPPTQFQTPAQFQTPPQFQVPQSVPQNPTSSTAKWVYPVFGLLLGVIVVLGFLVFYQLGKKDEKISVNANSNKETSKSSETPISSPTGTVQPTQAQTYNPNAGKYPEGSTRLLNENDISGKSNWDLRIMRNEIFARHGRKFKNAELRSYFMSQSWYSPRFDEVQISEIEKRNVEFLKNYE